MLQQNPALMYGLSYFLFFVLIEDVFPVTFDTPKVTGFTGHNITLPCLYDAQTLGILSVCWGQSRVPLTKCSNPILSSRGNAVLFRQSPKYQLLGRVMEGDVSLTIVNAQRIDAGVYGCRVEVPGWFNDIKINIHLTMKEEMWTELASITVPIIETKVEKIKADTNQKKVLTHLDLCYIGKMAAIVFLPVILILVVLIRRRMPLTEKCSRTSVTSENVYESILMTT
ncbi:T-cell immunoglobulin and mucin domain-containing protein 4 [Oryzias latipes]|uniref:T-cell immunoglobulin and mucin domain-containing protein 4 n=1 Tax=Oryzias latipes TaxID=8090 RepID=UPI0002A4C80E|nr:T-cell immunoglobulin and mucin domain-containing protein 4 [Oryzias latipes]